MRLPKGLSVIDHNGMVLAKLYKTMIVVVQNGTIQLDTGGWHTRHTAKCMNIALSKFETRVFVKKGQWYAQYQNDTPVPFIDGKNYMPLIKAA